MHGKSAFPWPRKLPKLRLHNQPHVLSVHWSDQAPITAFVHPGDTGMGQRLQILLQVSGGMATMLRQRHRQGSLAIQLHDEDPQIPCLRIDASSHDVDDQYRPLIPDPYCLMTGGYKSLRERIEREPLPPWRERLPLAFWRGSTTGSKDIDLNSIESNRRYQLAA